MLAHSLLTNEDITEIKHIIINVAHYLAFILIQKIVSQNTNYIKKKNS